MWPARVSDRARRPAASRASSCASTGWPTRSSAPPAAARRVEGSLTLRPAFPNFPSFKDYRFYDIRRANEGFDEKLAVGPGTLTSGADELIVQVPDAAHSFTIAAAVTEDATANRDFLLADQNSLLIECAPSLFGGWVRWCRRSRRRRSRPARGPR